jgi:hypothetical protein
MMKWKSVSQVLLIAFVLWLIVIFSLWHVQQISLAQGGSLTLSKRLNRTGNVVRVGEVLSFNIVMTNDAGFTLTNVTLIDEYAANIMAFSHAEPAMPDITTTGALTWSNVASPSLGMGETITYTVYFTAEHPQTSVVNEVRAEDITGTAQSVSDTLATDNTGDLIGGAAPIVKSLHPPDLVVQGGWPLTFTHRITNDGAAMLVYLPLTDTYDANFLEFNFAIPPPDVVNQTAGLLRWTDLTTYFGDIPPFASVVVTTVFTAAVQIDDTVNSASVEGALDEYSNDLTSNDALVPITIIDDTATPASNNDDDDDDDRDTPTATPVAAPTATAEVTTTIQINQSAPLYLPETGHSKIMGWIFPLLGLLLFSWGFYLAKT